MTPVKADRTPRRAPSPISAAPADGLAARCRAGGRTDRHRARALSLQLTPPRPGTPRRRGPGSAARSASRASRPRPTRWSPRATALQPDRKEESPEDFRAGRGEQPQDRRSTLHVGQKLVIPGERLPRSRLRRPNPLRAETARAKRPPTEARRASGRYGREVLRRQKPGETLGSIARTCSRSESKVADRRGRRHLRPGQDPSRPGAGRFPGGKDEAALGRRGRPRWARRSRCQGASAPADGPRRCQARHPGPRRRAEARRRRAMCRVIKIDDGSSAPSAP